ncbi:AAC_collapsed_G0021830.mRNA.1.CDS.1 [Saccharomyces cerevisiae]|nr:AAC_collapsed_G0021830.mRNA.1.CDS.1 [Saccharomyces cerevisiae]
MKHNRPNGTGKAVSGFKQIIRRLLLLLNKKRRKQLVIILKRITQVYGINLVFYVKKWKLKKLQGENIQINDIMPWLRESTILVLLNILYPTLMKFPFLKNHYIHWSSIVGISLMLTKGEVPSWIIAHFLVEAIASKLKIAKLTQWLKKKFFPGYINKIPANSCVFSDYCIICQTGQEFVTIPCAF